MEIISDNSFDDNQSNGSSCMSSYSSDISEENEIPDELKDEARASKRKLDWEERFKRVSKATVFVDNTSFQKYSNISLRSNAMQLKFERRFQFEEMDRMSGADNSYDILDEDQMTKYALEVNEAGKTNRTQ